MIPVAPDFGASLAGSFTFGISLGGLTGTTTAGAAPAAEEQPEVQLSHAGAAQQCDFFAPMRAFSLSKNPTLAGAQGSQAGAQVGAGAQAGAGGQHVGAGAQHDFFEAKCAFSLSRKPIFSAAQGSQAGAQEDLHFGAQRALILSSSFTRDEAHGSQQEGAAPQLLQPPA